MMGYQTGDDWVPGRGRVKTLKSHQSEILHSLIFLKIDKLVSLEINYEPPLDFSRYI